MGDQLLDYSNKESPALLFSFLRRGILWEAVFGPFTYLKLPLQWVRRERSKGAGVRGSSYGSQFQKDQSLSLVLLTGTVHARVLLLLVNEGLRLGQGRQPSPQRKANLLNFLLSFSSHLQNGSLLDGNIWSNSPFLQYKRKWSAYQHTIQIRLWFKDRRGFLRAYLLEMNSWMRYQRTSSKV